MDDTCQVKVIDTFVATIGCYHAKFGQCPPFHLRDFVDGWRQAGIPLEFCLGRIKNRLLNDFQLRLLDREIRTGWHQVMRSQDPCRMASIDEVAGGQPSETRKFLQGRKLPGE